MSEEDLYTNTSFLRFWEGRSVESFSRHPLSQDALLECVIVEPRRHANLRGVCANISYMFPNAAMTIIHSQENADFVSEQVVGANIQRIPIFQANINRNDYSALLTDPAFWRDVMRSPRTLIFQTDTGVRANRILRYMEYDYVGAPWSWIVAGDPRISIGNGGLSLRSRSLMTDICARYQRDPGYVDPTDSGEPEDIFFARHLVDCDDAALPSQDIASSFAVEHNYHPDPMGFHKAYEFHSEEIVQKWLARPQVGYDAVLDVKDAWIELANGHRVHDDRALRDWVGLGVNGSGILHIPAQSRVPFTRDPAPGQRKFLRIILHHPQHPIVTCRILLNRGRTVDAFTFPCLGNNDVREVHP